MTVMSKLHCKANEYYYFIYMATKMSETFPSHYIVFCGCCYLVLAAFPIAMIAIGKHQILGNSNAAAQAQSQPTLVVSSF